MEIGNGVVVDVGAVVEARRVGEGSVVEIGARIGRGAVVGKVCCYFISPQLMSGFVDRRQHCKIGPLCEVAAGEVVPDYTVIYGHGMRRVDTSGVGDLKMKMIAKQVEVLRKLIPSNLAKFQ